MKSFEIPPQDELKEPEIEREGSIEQQLKEQQEKFVENFIEIDDQTKAVEAVEAAYNATNETISDGTKDFFRTLFQIGVKDHGFTLTSMAGYGVFASPGGIDGVLTTLGVGAATEAASRVYNWIEKRRGWFKPEEEKEGQ